MINTKELYDSYLSEIEYSEVKTEHITTNLLHNLKEKEGIMINSSNNLPFFINRKIEPMKFLNQVIIMEKTDEFTIMDVFGMEVWKDDAENCIEFLIGLTEECEDFI